MESIQQHTNERSRLVGHHYAGAAQRSHTFSIDSTASDSAPPTTMLHSLWQRFLIATHFDKITTEQLSLATSVICLMFATAVERVTFKMTVDRMVPYRFVLVELIFATSVIVYFGITYIKKGFTNLITPQMKNFPHSKLMIMAVLDTIYFSGLIVSAAGVCPTMTVILLHASTPCLVLGSRYTFPDRKYSEVQLRGVLLIGVAVLINTSSPVFNMIVDPKLYTAPLLSCIMYLSMSALHGIATLYKEKALIEWSHPMDIHYLSSWLFLYQFIAALVLAPAIYVLQGISSDWKDFPLNSLLDNVNDGWACFIGEDPNPIERYDPSYADCSMIYVLVLAYVVSNVVVLECIDRVLRTSDQILGRVMAAAVFVAFLALGLYDTEVDDYGRGLFGTSVATTDVVAIVVLLYGMEVYGRDQEPDVEVITNYSS